MSSSVVGKSVILVPPHTITQSETHDLVDLLVSDPKERVKIHNIVKNTHIAKRHSCIPIEKVLEQDTSPGGRHSLYLPIAREFTQRVAERALYEVNATAADIDAIIVTSCTGFTMPSLGNYLISDMGFRHTTRVLPVAQWGCAGSVAALNWAHTHCVAYPSQSVLFIAVELCSLLYQPSDKDLSMMICNSLFGDAAGGVVIMGEKSHLLNRTWPHSAAAFRILRHETFCPPDKMHYLYYDEDHEGWHFRLAPNVVSTVGTIAPYLKDFLEHQCGQDLRASSMRYLVHTGGPKILQELLDELFQDCKIKKGDGRVISMDGCNEKNTAAANYLGNTKVKEIDNSLTTMRAFGNTSSVTVLTEMRLQMQEFERNITTGVSEETFPAVLVACGPGFTAEWAYGKFFARPVEKRVTRTSVERPVCFTMELPKIGVLVLGMSTTGAFVAAHCCSSGINVGSVADLTCENKEKTRPLYSLTNDCKKTLSRVGFKTSTGQSDRVDVESGLKDVLVGNRAENRCVPLWEYRLAEIVDKLDVDRQSRFEKVNNDDVISVVLEHVPTGVTQQVQCLFIVSASTDPEETRVCKEFAKKSPRKIYEVAADLDGKDSHTNSDLPSVLEKCTSVCEEIERKVKTMRLWLNMGDGQSTGTGVTNNVNKETKGDQNGHIANGHSVTNRFTCD